jgi:microcin C transport system substrate-binding protein
MIKYLKILFIIIFTFSNGVLLEARKIKLKSKKSISNNSSTYGGINFENELNSFQNDSDENQDKKNKYYGWTTNTNVRPSGSDKAVKGGILTMLGGDEYPTTFRSLGKDSRHQINSLMDGLQNEPLLGFNYEYLEWEPVIATHWKIADDSLNYWFRIDPRARWGDGREIISKDIVAAFKLHIDDGHQDPNVSSYYNDLFEIPVAESKYIVKITAKKKDWRTFRSAAQFIPMPSFYLDKVDGAGYIDKYNFSFMPGSGAYEYDNENSKKGNEGFIVLKRKDNYWAKNHKRNNGLNNFDQIKFIFIEDENQQVVSFMNGDYDIYPWSRAQWWVERFTKEKYSEINNGWVQKVKIYNYLPKGPSGVVFNTQKKPYDDIRIRKAFAHLFDVDKLNKRLFFNEYTRLNTFFFGTPYSNPRNNFTEYNPQKALEILNESGWSRPEGEQWLKNKAGEIFEFNFIISQGGDRIYSTFQEDLKQVGIKMEFEQLDGNAAFSKVMKKEFEVTSQGWTAGFFPGPEGMMHSKYADKVEVTNITSMAIPELDILIDTYNAEWDAKKRIPLAQQIDSIAVNSYHYALGWTSPYGARMLYWNKLDMPEWGLYYASGWQSPLTLWWVDPSKEHQLIEAKKNNTSMPYNNEIIDYWNRTN